MQLNNNDYAFVQEDKNRIRKVVFKDFNRFNRSNHTDELYILFWKISQA